MAWRDSVKKSKPEPIQIMTCDQCAKDIGTSDGFGSKEYIEISLYPASDIIIDEIESLVFCGDSCTRNYLKRIKLQP